MSIRDRDGKLLYHLTAIENLGSIATHGLLSRSDLRERRLVFEDVADASILRDRGDLNRYIPFHFFAKNPFDYRVCRENPNTTMMILAVTRHRAMIANWQVIPTHPLSGDGQAQVLPWTQGMQAIDWDLMEMRDFNDRACKQVCMAEALSPVPVYLSDCLSIYVPTEAAGRIVRGVVGSSGPPHVNVNAKMFP